MLYNSVWVSAIQQRESAIIIYIYLLPLELPSPLPPLQVVTKRQAGLPVLHSSFLSAPNSSLTLPKPND